MPTIDQIAASLVKTPTNKVVSTPGLTNQQFNQTLGYEGLVPVVPVKAPAPPPSIAPVNYGSGGGSGSSGTGSGSATGAAPKKKKLSKFELSEIQAVLDAIGARYDYEGQALRGQKQSLIGAFRLLKQQQEKEEAQALHESEQRAAGSGRIRSGLFLKDQSRIADAFADQLVRARAERDSQLSPLQQALGSLKAREEAEAAAKAREIALEQLGTQEALAQALALV